MDDGITFQQVMLINESLVQAGVSLHWLQPRKKNPIFDGWQSAQTQDVAALRASHRPNANIGVRPGEWSKIGNKYLHLIDLDVRKDDCATEAWASLLQMLPTAKVLPTVISGSGGESRHIYFLTSTPFRKKKLRKSTGFSMIWDAEKGRDVKKYDWEIDLYGTGAYAVLPPSIHPDTGLPYRWLRPIDLDMTMLMEIPADLIEALGASESSAQAPTDEDDLEAIFLASPLDISPEDLDAVMNDLPEDWVDDRDQWLTVGAALHHQFKGANAGFERWCEWARQSEKFDAKDSARVWKSFKGNRNPVRLPTLIQAASTNRMKQDQDFEEDSTDLSDFLGDAHIAVKTGNPVELDSDWERLLHRNEEGELKSTLANMHLIVKNDARTRQVPAYNEFTQSIVLRAEPGRRVRKRDKGKPVVNLESPIWKVRDPLNGSMWSDSHDRAIRRFIEAPTTQGGYGIKVSDRDLIAAVDGCARENIFHPIRECMEGLVWDHRMRAETLFIDYLGCDDTAYHRQTAILTLLGAVARIYEPGHKFDFVPILEGAQGKGKSTMIKILGMNWSGELTGDISKPADMIAQLQGLWIIEIGELSAMARHEVNELKAFVSRSVDKGRLPYEKRPGEFPRQCIFIGSTNDREYLRDATGNRRYWPILCKLEGEIDNAKLAREVKQIWAEAVVMYKAMRAAQRFGDLPLFLTDNAVVSEAVTIQESRRIETPEDALCGQIMAWLDTPIGSADGFEDLGATPILRQETCMAQIWVECLGRSGAIPHTEATKIGRAMLLTDWTRTASQIQGQEINKKYGKVRLYLRS